MTARAMSDEQIDAAIMAALNMPPAVNPPPTDDMRAIYRAAYAAATRDTAERAEAICAMRGCDCGEVIMDKLCRKVGEA